MRDPRINPRAGDVLYQHGIRHDVIIASDDEVTFNVWDGGFSCAIEEWRGGMANAITEIKEMNNQRKLDEELLDAHYIRLAEIERTKAITEEAIRELVNRLGKNKCTQ